MGHAQGLSQIDGRVQILALQLGDHMNFLRCISASHPYLSSGVLARRPTLGFERMCEFNEMVRQMQGSAQCLPH